jgi:hypothetical protein
MSQHARLLDCPSLARIEESSQPCISIGLMAKVNYVLEHWQDPVGFEWSVPRFVSLFLLRPLEEPIATQERSVVFILSISARIDA